MSEIATSDRLDALLHDMTGMDIRGNIAPAGCNLSRVNLTKANLSNTSYHGAMFVETVFVRTDLRGADLSGSYFERPVSLDAAIVDESTRLERTAFHDTACYGADFSGVRMGSARFLGGEFLGCRFESTDFDSALFQGVDMEGSTFERASLSDAKFILTRGLAATDIGKAATLDGVLFGHVSLPGYVFDGRPMEGAHFVGCDLQGASFRGADLTGAVFETTIKYRFSIDDDEPMPLGQTAPMAGVHFDTAILAGAKFAGLDLSAAFFIGADLSQADMEGCTLTEANLSGAVATGANLAKANLRGANLAGCDLRGANLAGCDLRGADLRGADLTGCDLRGADLTGTRLEGVKSMRGARLDATTTLRDTRFDGACMDGALMSEVRAFGCHFAKAGFDGTEAAFAVFQDCDFTGAKFDGSDGLSDFGAHYRGCHWGERTKSELDDWPAAARDQRVEAAMHEAPKKAAAALWAGGVVALEAATHTWVVPVAKTVATTVLAPALTAAIAHHSSFATLVGYTMAKRAGVFDAFHRHVLVHIPLPEGWREAPKALAEKALDWGKDKAIDFFGERLDETQETRLRGMRVGDAIRVAANAFADRFAMDGDDWAKRYVATVCFLRRDRSAFKSALKAGARRNKELARFGEFSTDVGHIVICHKRAARQAHRLLRAAAAKGEGPPITTVFTQDRGGDTRAPAVVSVLPDGGSEAAWFDKDGLALKVRWAPDSTPMALVGRTAGGWFTRMPLSEAPLRDVAFAAFSDIAPTADGIAEPPPGPAP